MLLKENTFAAQKIKSKNIRYHDKLEIEEFNTESKTNMMKSLMNADNQYSPKHSYLRNGSRRSLQLPGEFSLLSTSDINKSKNKKEDDIFAQYDGLDRDTCIEEENKRDITKIEASFTILGGRYERVIEDNRVLKQRLAILHRDKLISEERYRQRLADLNRKLIASSTSHAHLTMENAELMTNARLLIQQLRNERAITKLESKKRMRRTCHKRTQVEPEDVIPDKVTIEDNSRVREEKSLTSISDKEQTSDEGVCGVIDDKPEVMMQRCFDTILNLSLSHQQRLEEELAEHRKHRKITRKHTGKRRQTTTAVTTTHSSATNPSPKHCKVNSCGTESSCTTASSTTTANCDVDCGDTVVSEADSAFTNDDVVAGDDANADSNSVTPATPLTTPLATPTGCVNPVFPGAILDKSSSRSCIRSSVLKERRNGILDGTLLPEGESMTSAPSLTSVVTTRTAGKIAMAFKRLKSKTQTSSSSINSSSATTSPQLIHSPPDTPLLIMQQHRQNYSTKATSLR